MGTDGTGSTNAWQYVSKVAALTGGEAIDIDGIADWFDVY